MDTGWLSRPHADVPPGEEWLGENERRVSAHLKVAQRRADWRLGRWTAKAALGLWLGLAPSRFEVLAAPDGAPEAWLDGERVPVSVSLSHRGGRALAVVSEAPGIVGCDLELLEPRSGAFVREWLAPCEQRMIYSCGAAQRVLLANLFWAAKEACTKVRRQGLALNVRRAVVTLTQARPEPGQWCPLRVSWSDGPRTTTSGWWRAEPGWVMVVAGEPAPGAPRQLCPPRLKERIAVPSGGHAIGDQALD